MTSSASAAKEAAAVFKKTSSNQKHKHTDSDVETDDDEVGIDGPVLAGLDVPQPVFFCSIEAPSISKQAEMEKALDKLQREDPSIQVKLCLIFSCYYHTWVHECLVSCLFGVIIWATMSFRI